MKGAYEIGSATERPSLPTLRQDRLRKLAFGGNGNAHTVAHLRKLSQPARDAILILHYQTCLIRSGAQWVTHRQNKVQESVVLALFDRYLVSIFVENRPAPRCRYIARLTDIGRLIGSALANDEHTAIEDATEVYLEAAE